MLSDEDKALFRAVTKSVKPLKKTEVRTPVSGRVAVGSTKSDIPETKPASRKPQIHLSSYYYETVDAEAELSWCQHSIPGKRLAELKQGHIRREGKLDLHGLNPEQASQALVDFIETQHSQNHRCLLIIHGKGSHGQEAPILKNLVRHWLPQIPQVLAFHSAMPKDGGKGALYVLLKRDRNERKFKD